VGRRRRKKVRRIRRTRKLTSIRYFECPVCGQPTLTIEFKKLEGKPGYKLAEIKCGSCGLHLRLEVPELLDRIDVYNRVVDLAYEGRLDEYSVEAEEPASPAAPSNPPEASELDELLAEVVDEGEESGEAEDKASGEG
jgi:transcription elongation factor Elf1